MNVMNDTTEHRHPPVLDYLNVLVRWRWLIIKLVLVSSIMVAIMSLVMPKTYESSSVIIPTRETSGVNVFDTFSGNLFGLGLGSGTTELYLLKAILDSRTLREHIIQEYDLQEVYEVGNMDEAVLALSEHITITLTEDNTLVITFAHQTGWFSFNKRKEEEIKQFVQQIALSIIQRLDLLNRHYQGQEARNYRLFIEERRNEIYQELTILEDSLMRYQEKNEIMAVDAQLQATLETAALLEAEIIKEELEYAIAEAKLGSENPMIKGLRDELRAAKTAFESSLGGRNDEKRFLLGYNRDLPALMKEYLRLYREIRIQSEIFTFITTKYEESKLKEAQDIPTINVLDYPDVPDIRSAPRRAFMVITTGVLMTIFAFILAFILDFLRRMKIEFPEQYQELTGWMKLRK